MVTIKRRVARLALAPVAAIMFGVAAAILVAAVPVGMFESAVMATGLPQALSIAEPPLGLKARILAILLAFLAVTAVSWVVIAPIERWLDRDRRRRTPWADGGYAHVGDDEGLPPVDALRKPILATDELGAPLMSDGALATVPALVDEIMAPDAELEAPIVDEELMPAGPAAAPMPEPWTPTTSADGETSIHALIRRLEAGLARRGGTDPDPGAAAASTPLTLVDEWIVGEGQAADSRRTDDFSAALGSLKKFAWR